MDGGNSTPATQTPAQAAAPATQAPTTQTPQTSAAVPSQTPVNPAPAAGSASSSQQQPQRPLVQFRVTVDPTTNKILYPTLDAPKAPVDFRNVSMEELDKMPLEEQAKMSKQAMQMLEYNKQLRQHETVAAYVERLPLFGFTDPVVAEAALMIAENPKYAPVLGGLYQIKSENDKLKAENEKLKAMGSDLGKTNVTLANELSNLSSNPTYTNRASAQQALQSFAELSQTPEWKEMGNAFLNAGKTPAQQPAAPAAAAPAQQQVQQQAPAPQQPAAAADAAQTGQKRQHPGFTVEQLRQLALRGAQERGMGGSIESLYPANSVNMQGQRTVEVRNSADAFENKRPKWGESLYSGLGLGAKKAEDHGSVWDRPTNQQFVPVKWDS